MATPHDDQSNTAHAVRHVADEWHSKRGMIECVAWSFDKDAEKKIYVGARRATPKASYVWKICYIESSSMRAPWAHC